MRTGPCLFSSPALDQRRLSPSPHRLSLDAPRSAHHIYPSHDERALPTSLSGQGTERTPFQQNAFRNERDGVHPCIPSFSSLATLPESLDRPARVRPSSNDSIERRTRTEPQFPPHFLLRPFRPRDEYRRPHNRHGSTGENLSGDAESYVRLGTRGRDERERGGVPCERRESLRRVYGRSRDQSG